MVAGVEAQEAARCIILCSVFRNDGKGITDLINPDETPARIQTRLWLCRLQLQLDSI